MKIVSPQLGLRADSTMGGEVHDYKILEALFRQGAHLDIFLPRNRAEHPDWPEVRFEKTFLPVPLAFLFNFFSAAYFFKRWRKEKFDLIRVHSPYFVGLGALFFRLFHPAPVVATYHHDFQEGFFFRLIDRLIAHRFDKIITVSQDSRKKILEYYPKIRPEKVAVIHNGVGEDLKPAPKNDEVARVLGLKEKRILLFIGRLEKRKNVFFLLKIMERLPENITLIIIGEGPEKARLKKETNNRKLASKILFINGKISAKEKLDFFNLADIFVFPSLLEGFGLAVAEAAACGLPAIVANTSSLPEVVEHERTGLVVDLDEDKWQKAILDLLADEKRRLAMGEAARERALNLFNWDRAAEKTMAIYQEAISQSSSGKERGIYES